MQTVNINLIVPEAWHELSDKQLRYVYQLLAEDFSCQREQSSNLFETIPSAAENGRSHFATDEIKTLCLLRWSGAKVIGKQDNGAYLLKKGTFRANERKTELAPVLPNAAEIVAKQNVLFEVTPLTIAELLPHLDWLAAVPKEPVRLSKINRRKAIAADFEGISVENYIIIDNLYQGYLTTQDDAILDQMTEVLYGHPITLKPYERISVFYWIAALKEFFARRYPDFLRLTSEVSNGDLLGGKQQTPEEAMNAQIRALTKGDVTKEKEILALDTWRALTELNAQAREYRELNSQLKANGK